MDTVKLTPDGLTGDWAVKLHPGAQAALQDAEAGPEPEQREAGSALPGRSVNPVGSQGEVRGGLGRLLGTPVNGPATGQPAWLCNCCRARNFDLDWECRCASGP